MRFEGVCLQPLGRARTALRLEYGIGIQSRGLITPGHVGLLVTARCECGWADGAGGVGTTASSGTASAGLHLIARSVCAASTRLAAATAAISTGHAEECSETTATAGAGCEDQETKGKGSVTLHDIAFWERGIWWEMTGTNSYQRLRSGANRVGEELAG